jgi:DNA uptake protein ComE-like DNA-binding protein
MLWHDFFYFSKGERSGLIVLLSLVVIACTILFITRRPDAEVTPQLSPDKPASVDSALFVKEKTDTAAPSKMEAGSASSESAKASSSKKTPEPTKAPNKPKESVSQRVDRLTSYAQPTYTRVEKFKEGTTVELNTADTVMLKKVPGIGSSFAKRIVGYRAILGGYYSVTQLSEVYGIDEERYNELHPWFTADASLLNKLNVNTVSQDSLQRHPYISYAQAKVIVRLRRQKGKLTGWENLQLLDEFTDSDKKRLQPYLSFD